MTDTFELPSELPEGPWHTGRLPPAQWRYICDANGNTIAAVAEWDEDGNLVQEFGGAVQAQAVARAIASIPAMVAEIERLRNRIDELQGSMKLDGRYLSDIENLRAQLEKYERAFNASANAMRMDSVLAENDRLRAENAELRQLVKQIAEVPLWRDRYPDGPDIGMGGRDNRATGYFSTDQVRQARALLAKEPS